jgi:hypothetical protein
MLSFAYERPGETRVNKVIVKSLNPKPSKKGKRSSVVEKLYTDASGNKRVIRKIDARSRTFSGDLQFVFRKNVGEARRENKRILGAADYAPRKG